MAVSTSEALVVWLNTFTNTTVKCSSFADLADGIQLFEIVAEIAPHELDVAQCKREEDNWVLSMQNVKHIVAALQRYFVDDLKIDLRLEERIDSKAIAQEKDEGQLLVLVEAVLGAAVECEEKALYIGRIMELPPDCQKQMMLIIEGVMELQSQSTIADSSLSALDVSHAEDAAYLRMQLEETQTELERVREERDEAVKVHERVSQQLFDAEALAVRLKEEKESYATAVRDLEQQMTNMQQEQEASAASAASASQEGDSLLGGFSSTIEDKSRELAAQALQEEVLEKNGTIQQLRKRLTETEREAAEARELRDELDVMKERMAGYEQDKERMQRMKQRLEKENDLKSLLADTEAQRDRLKTENGEQQREISKLLGAVKAMEALKERAAEIHAENSKQSEEQEKLSLQLSHSSQANAELEAKISFLTQQNTDLEAVVLNLQDEIDAKRADVTEDSMGTISFSDGLNEEMKERLLKIELENDRLTKLIAEENAEHDAEVAELQQAEVQHKATISSLEEKFNSLQECMKAAEDAAGASSTGLSEEIELLKAEVMAKSTALEEATTSLTTANERIGSTSAELENYRAEVEALKASLEEKSSQLEMALSSSATASAAAEESVQRSVESIAALEQRLQEKSNAEELSQKERERLEGALEEAQEKAKSLAEQLVASAAEKAELEARAESFLGERDGLSQELHDSKHALECLKKEATLEAEQSAQRLKETEKSLDLARQQMEEAAEQARAADSDLEGSLARQQERIRELQLQLQQQQQLDQEIARQMDLRTAERDTLHTEFEAAKEELEEAKAAKLSLEEQLEKALEQQSSAEEDTYAKLEEGAQQLTEAKEALAAAREQLEQRAAAASVVESEQGSALASLEARVVHLEAALEKEKKEKEALKESFSSLEETKEEVEERNRSLAGQLAEAKKASDEERALEATSAAEQLQTLRLENANLSQLVTQQAQKVADMQKLATDSLAQRDDLRKQMLELSASPAPAETSESMASPSTPQNTAVTSGQAAVLQAQLQEKEAAVAQLEMELRMVSSSLHALGLKVQKEFSGGQALQAASFEPLSFLGQRRAAAGM